MPGEDGFAGESTFIPAHECHMGTLNVDQRSLLRQEARGLHEMTLHGCFSNASFNPIPGEREYPFHTLFGQC